MKRKLFYFTILLFLIKSAIAQTPVTATWSLATDGTGVGTGGLVPANQTLGSAISGTLYNYTFGTVAGWQRSASTVNLPSAYNANSYVEYSVTIPAGKKLNLTSVSFNALGGGTGSVRFAVYYSLNGFLESSSLGTINYNSINYSNDTGTINSASALNTSTTPLTGQQVASISPNIDVTQGKTLTVRIYVWAGSAGRYFASKSFVLGGMLSDDTTPAATQYALTTSLSDNSAGIISRTPNNTQYDSGENVSLNATANFGYKFIKWVDAANGDADLTTNNPYVVTMNAAKNIKAVFQAVTTYNFTLNKVGSNWGEVQLSPLPTGGKYEAGTEVTMTVIPNKVTTFNYWEDNSTGLQRTVTVNSDLTFTATFDEIPFILGWDFRDQTVRISRTADYYSESTNTGLISTYKPDNTPIAWLGSPSAFSPAYPCFRYWTVAANFATERRFVKASFSTTGYKNIQVKSLVSGNYQCYSVQKLQYSLDDVTYTDLASVDITTAYNSTWKDLNATLPVDAEGKTKIYLKWIGDTTSPILGNTTDNDGTAFTNIFVFADKEIVNDTDAPLLVSTVPVASSSTATVNGSIVLTFNEKVKAGTGAITLDGKTLTGVYGSKTATFTYEKLNYDTQYTLTVPAGALTDQSGNTFAGTTLTFKTGARTEPTKKLFDAVVAKDGSGDYLSVIDAIAAAPSNRTIPWLIYIKNGTYTGHHDIPSTKPFIHLIGQSRDGVVISDNRLAGAKVPDDGTIWYPVSTGATMTINSTDCYFENITLENSYGYGNLSGPQCLALYSTKDRFTMNHCWLRSYQDTYLTSYSGITDRHYLKDTRIEGAVDFIYGGGDVFFDKDTITCNRSTGGYIVAPSHDASTAWGYVFSNCIINKSIAAPVTTYLGRPWHNAPKTVFINAKLGQNTSIYAAGWYYKMNAIPAIFADYNTMDVNGNPVDLSQRISDYEYDDNGTTVHGTAKSSLTDQEAANYTYENVILRSGDTWDPRLMAEAPNQPTNLQLSGANLTWDAVSYTRLYVVFRNSNVLGFTLSNQFTDATAVSGTAYNYTVQAVGEYGALSKLANPVQTLPLDLLSFTATLVKDLTPKVNLTWKTTNEKNTAKFELERTVDGKTFEKLGTVAASNTSGIHTYSFVDAKPLFGSSYYRLNQIDIDSKNKYSDLKVVNNSGEISLSLYPNPVSNELNITHSKAGEKASIEVISMNGRKVAGSMVQTLSTFTKIDLSGIPSGTYVLKFNNGAEKSVAKFIKK